MQKDIGDDGLDPWRWSIVILAEAILSTSISVIQLHIRICNGDLSPASSQLQTSINGWDSVSEVTNSAVAAMISIRTQASK